MIAVNILSVIISLSVLVTVVGEVFLHFVKKRRFYRYIDVVTNIQTLLLYQMLGAVALGVIYLVYQWIYTNFSLIEQNVNSPLAWLAGFILADFCHYWFHRSAHRNNFLWGIHQGHHSSEDFNLSTALRKGIFQLWIDWPFFLPMAVLGYPFFEMYLPLKGLQFSYQFWLHNQYIGKLPLLEKVMVTPSLHRVHHGQNPQYIDKNHAGVFIIWDKLFGTFAEEKEPVIYGTTEAVNSFNPIGIQFVWWRNLWRDAVNTKRWRDKLAIPFMPTGWRPADVADKPRDNKISNLDHFKPFDRPLGSAIKVYVAMQVAVVIYAFSALAEGSEYHVFSNALHGFSALFLLLSCGVVGQLLNGKAYAIKLEWCRQIGLLALSLILLEQSVLPLSILVVTVLSILALASLSLWDRYFRDKSAPPITNTATP